MTLSKLIEFISESRSKGLDLGGLEVDDTGCYCRYLNNYGGYTRSHISLRMAKLVVFGSLLEAATPVPPPPPPVKPQPKWLVGEMVTLRARVTGVPGSLDNKGRLCVSFVGTDGNAVEAVEYVMDERVVRGSMT